MEDSAQNTKPQDPYKSCEGPTDWTAPEPPKPQPCEQPCCCPSDPGGGSSDCLQSVITEESKKIAAADQAKAFVDVLGQIQKSANDAKGKYTRSVYESLRDGWIKFDGDLLLRVTKQLECTIRCWECVVECRLCPLLKAIRDRQLVLDGKVDNLPKSVDSLRELLCWHQRNVAFRQADFDRVNGVLTAWVTDPVGKLQKAMADNIDLAGKILDTMATDNVGALWNIFMRLLPLHMAIAPRGQKSAIDPAYLTICDNCDPDDPTWCCTVHVGERSIRQQLIGPVPYIVDPDRYPDVICCLVTQRYQKASVLLAKAKAEYAEVQSRIERVTTEIGDRKKSLADDFKGDLTTPIDCKQYWKKPANGQDDPCKRQPAAS